MMRNFDKLLPAVAMAGMLTGCLGGTPGNTTTQPASTTTNTSGGSAQTDPTDTTNPANANNTSSGGTANTFSHEDDSTIDPFQVLARIQEEGPPEVATRMHSCAKMKYATLANVLSNVGIDPTTGNAVSAGGLYKSGSGALGKPDYANRLAESAGLSTAGAVRLYDIFVAGAPGIVAAMPTQARCMVAGAPTSMFTTDGSACTPAGITCVTGSPATKQQKDLCDSAVQSNTSDMVGTGTTAVTVGQVVAVASLMAAAHSCE